MTKRPFYATAGERVTCENGHAVCSFTRDAVCGEPFNQSRFLGNWQQPEPKAGDTNIGCAVCGAPFYDGLALHFADGYRYAELGLSPGRNGDMRPGLGARFNYGAT